MKAAGSTPPASALSTPAASGASTLGPTPAASLPPPEPNGPCPTSPFRPPPERGSSCCPERRTRQARRRSTFARRRSLSWPPMAHDSASTPHRRPRVLAGNASHHKAGSHILEGGGENGYAVTIRSQNFPSLFSWEANLNVVDDGSTYTASE